MEKQEIQLINQQENMLNELDLLYKEYIGWLLSNEDNVDEIENGKLSSPHLLDVSTPEGNYLNYEFRILFVGQETFGWFNEKQREKEGLLKLDYQIEKYLIALKAIYKNHNLGHGEKQYLSSIYSFIDFVYNTTERDKKIKPGVLLTNLLRHDYDKKTLPFNKYESLNYQNNYILRKEIEILKPNAIVFLTGPNYDKYIIDTYPNIIFNKIEGYEINHAALLRGIPNIEKTIRINHPGRINRLGVTYKREIVNKILELFL